MRRAPTRPVLVSSLLGLALAAGVAIVPPAAGPVAPAALQPWLAAIDAPAALAAGDLGIRTATRYVVVPDKGIVRAVVNVTATNEKPDTTVGGATTRYFYDGMNLGVQPEARNVRATQDGAPVRVDVSERDGYRLVAVLFRSGLFFGQQAEVRLAFDLPAGKPRSNSDVRVGPAFASFLAWSFGDTGTVRIDVPKAFDVDISGSELSKTTTAKGTQVFRARTSNPISWFAWVNARNDAGLTREQLQLADGEVVLVRAWPEDSRWRRRVGRILSESIPDLTRRIGLPWPVDGPLSVLEIHTPLLEGYAGFYDPKTDEITISEDLDDTTIVHEASHAWFNQRLFAERWITEGLAETYAMAVVEDAPGRKAVDPDAAVAFPLNEWPGPSPIADDEASSREQFGYDAAYQVMAGIVASAGDEGMQRVFAAADAGTTAYPGESTPEKATLTENDWRRFLDLTEQLGGVPGVASLLQTWALTDDEAALLPARADARETYEALAAVADGWAAPVGVRLAMDGWRFDEAGAGIEVATSVIERRDAVAELAAAQDLEPPGGLEAEYEAATDVAAIRDVGAEEASAEASLQTLAAAATTVAAPRDWLTELGLSGKTPDAGLAEARDSWEAGRYDEAASLASFAAATIVVAPDAGRGRALVVGGIVGFVLLVLVAGIVAWRRSRRPARVAADAPATPVPTWTAWYAPDSARGDDSTTVVWTQPSAARSAVAATDDVPSAGLPAPDADPLDDQPPPA